MSEQFPVFDDHAEYPLHGEYVDVRQTDEWREFITEVQRAEQAMSLYDDPADGSACDLSARHSIELSGVFGYEYNGQPSRVLGLAYNDEGPQATVVFDVRHATFHGCDLKFINDRWQAAFEFYTDGTDNATPKGSYFVPVDSQHILELQIRADYGSDEDDVTAVQLFHEQAEAAQVQVTSADFAMQPGEAQRYILRNICDSAESDLPLNLRERDDVVIDCPRYYTRYDGMPGFDIRDFMTDSSSTERLEDFRPPQGSIDGYEFVELEGLPEGQALVAWNFDIAAGAPCLVIRDDTGARTHYVPLRDITDVI